jgi:hypothetical protein
MAKNSYLVALIAVGVVNYPDSSLFDSTQNPIGISRRFPQLA